MEIAENIQKAAENYLKFESSYSFPYQLAGTQFYLTHKDDQTVSAFGVAVHNDIEYKIGPKK